MPTSISQIHDVPSDPRGAGCCAFACRERGEFVVKYVGEVISMSEAATCEARYADVGKICTPMVIESRGHQIAYGVEKQGFIANDILVFPIELKFQLFLAIEQRYLPTHHHSKIGKLPPAKQLEIFYPLKSIRFGSYKITVTCTC